MKLKWWPRNPEPGDLIRVRVGAVWHYGVFVSEAEVIQFGLPPVNLFRDESRIEVCATDIDTFACGSIVETADPGRKRLPREKSIAMARARLGEKGYSLLHNNCEHFATECVLGERFCEEADAARQRWQTWRRGRERRAEEENLDR